MLVIGLTGGICSGKTMAARAFEQHGIETIDADAIAKSITGKDSDYTKAIISHFGSDILHADASLNRSALAEVIFSDHDARKWLEELLHPAIRADMADKIAKATSPYVVCVIPLLASDHPLVNRVLVIDSSPALQMERLINRDHLNEQQAQLRLDAQISQADRLAIADDIIVNDDSKQTFVDAVTSQHLLYIKTAKNP